MTTAEPAARAYVLLPGAHDPTSSGPTALVRVWGLSAEERLRRGLRRAGVADVRALAPDDSAEAPKTARIVAIRADHFYDERLLAALVGEGRDVLLELDGEPVAASSNGEALAEVLRTLRGAAGSSGEGLDALKRVAPLDLAPAYDPVLRKHDPPFAIAARADSVREAEERIFAASYKGITDFVTKWIFPRPARAATRLCVRRGISPNAVTMLSYVLVAATTVLFASGEFAAGLVLGWLMTFLDTVDGKLARVTLTSSRLGNVLDHGLDLVHPPIWWAAFAWGLAGGAEFAGWELSLAIVIGGYLVGRVLEGAFMLAFDQEMFTWRPFDGLFRQVIARRNPNLLLLSAGTAAGAAGTGFLLVAAWTLGSIAIQIVRIAQAFALKSAGVPIRSWYEEEPP